MQIKIHELIKKIDKKINYYLFYGPNTGLIEEIINKNFKPIFSKNIITYDEVDVLNNIYAFKEMIFNKSFFDNEKFIIINRASDKILDTIKELINAELTDIKIIIKAEILEKKSKLRSFFEKDKHVIATAFYEDNHQSLSLILQNIFRERKIKISNEIINLLIERSRGNRINLYNEIEKILSYAIKKNKINLEEIQKLTKLTENYNFSELVDQNLSKNKRKTLKILNENILNSDENILLIRTFLNKLKRLKKLKISFTKNNNIEQTLQLSKPPIFWKDKEIVKLQLHTLNLAQIKNLIRKVNKLELEIKKNNQISSQILNNFILENLISTNNVI